VCVCVVVVCSAWRVFRVQGLGVCVGLTCASHVFRV
jgi:hypothetical protein